MAQMNNSRMKSVTKTKRKKKQTIKNVELNSKEGQSDSMACNCAACDEVCLNHPETDDEQSIICNVCTLWYHKGCIPAKLQLRGES